MTCALLLIDIQNDYFSDGAMTLSGMEQAADNAARLLTRFRERGDAVYHVQHISTRPQAGFFLPDTPGIDIHPRVAPLNSESLTRKHFPNAFRATTLADTLRALPLEELVSVGAMSHRCIDASTRAAFDRGFKCAVVQDACATRDLAFNGETLKAREVHGAFMAALGSVYAHLTTTDDALRA